MIRSLLNFIFYLPTRLRKIRRLVWSREHCQTFYPEGPHKSRIQILVDLLWWLVRYQEVCRYYYYYGLDCADGRHAREYFADDEFRKIRDRLNATHAGMNPRRDRTGRSAGGEILLRHKLVFGQYLKGLGVPSPEINACGFEGELFWFESGETTGLDELCKRHLDVFIKDCQVDQGVRVFFLQCKDGVLKLEGEVIDPRQVLARTKIESPYILQDRVVQHSQLSEIYAGSVNTVRLITVRSSNAPVPFKAVLRIGAGGSVRDNWSTGGMVVGIDLSSGTLMEYGFQSPEFGRRLTNHPDTNVKFRGRHVPFFEEAKKLACRLHRFIPGVHSVGWDIGITPDGPVFIEGNDEWGVQTIQGPHGGIRRDFMAMAAAVREKRG